MLCFYRWMRNLHLTLMSTVLLAIVFLFRHTVDATTGERMNGVEGPHPSKVGDLLHPPFVWQEPSLPAAHTALGWWSACAGKTHGSPPAGKDNGCQAAAL